MSENMNVIRFARELARFESHLEQHIYRAYDHYDYCGEELVAVARSYLALLGWLADGEDLADAITGALRVYYEAEAASGERRREAEERRRAEYDEAARRHQLAVTVECPFCGAAPGAVCRTAGPTGGSHPKGVHDHKDRYRAASHILGAAGEDDHDPR